MKVGREQERDRGEGDERRQWRHGLVVLDLKSGRAGESKHGGRAHRQGLKCEVE